MGILKEFFGGGHEEVMGSVEYKRALARNQLPDILVLGGEFEMALHDSSVDRAIAPFMNISTEGLSPDEVKRIRIEEGELPVDYV